MLTNKRRILIGTDAHALDWMQRSMPALYQRLVTVSMRLAARFTPKPRNADKAREATE